MLEGHLDQVEAVQFSPNGQTVASGSWDGTIRLWDTKTGQCRNTLEIPLDETEEDLRIRLIAVASDFQTMISASDCVLHLWDIETGKCLSALHHDFSDTTAAIISSNGQIAASGSEYGLLRL